MAGAGRKKLRPLPAALCGLFGLFLAACALLVLNGLHEDIFPADLAVVLGNEVYRDGRCSPRLAARLERAVTLHRKGLVREIAVSGGVGKSGYDEATAMRDYLLAAGIPPGDIIVDSGGHNTRLTAKFTAAFMRARGYQKVIVVSQYFHLPRARLALLQEGAPLVGTAGADYFEWRDFYSVPRELPGLLAYWAGLR